MTKSRRNCKTKVLSVVFAAIITLLLLFSLVGCDKKQTISRVSYDLHILGAQYDDESSTATAFISLSGSDAQRLDGLKAYGERIFSRENLFFNHIDISVSLDGATIYAAVRDRGVMSRETPETDDEGAEVVKREYQNLKVVAIYDTIYKSIVTNGERRSNGSGYRDLLPIDESGATEFEISQRSQNSANWYALLIAAGIVLFMAAMAAYLAYLHKHKKDEAMPIEETYAQKE